MRAVALRRSTGGAASAATAAAEAPPEPGGGPTVTRFAGCSVGATVSGIDLARAAEQRWAGQLRGALSEHGVLLFRGQVLMAEDMLRAAALFGQPALPHPGAQAALTLYSVKDRDKTLRGSDFWHSDLSYQEVPGGPTLLYALRVPRGEDGKAVGDTLFADACAAAAALPADLREAVAGRSALHNIAHNGGHPLPAFASGQRAEPPDVAHPVLRRNPLSGAEALYVSPAYTRRVEGLAAKESESLLSRLFEHMLGSPRFLFKHCWEEGDLLVWDNGRVLHKATTVDMPPGAERVMWRVATHGVRGEEPDGGGKLASQA
eukprot:TRINITY_DN10953_c0_g1_i1.p1 TRINITY_DN10953_c0_g1~~TRINITY_DN10953_c0_g1_i1.p1  ORF type:complete len:341 (+),score=103.24 TRINITY_DN10953_c0_g1_i1:71-1024(+)